jgi:acyl-CoA synthetase (AMP-forming)/AMP-acid ligase II
VDDAQVLGQLVQGTLVEGPEHASEDYVKGLTRTLVVSGDTELISAPAYLKAAQHAPRLQSVVGVPVDGLTAAKAYVTLLETSGACAGLEDELREFCAAGLHRYQVPRVIQLVDSLPKTATGKIERYKLRRPGA